MPAVLVGYRTGSGKHTTMDTHDTTVLIQDTHDTPTEPQGGDWLELDDDDDAILDRVWARIAAENAAAAAQ